MLWLLTAMLLPGAAMWLSFYLLSPRFTAPVYSLSKLLILGLPLWLVRPGWLSTGRWQVRRPQAADLWLGGAVGLLVAAGAWALYAGVLRGSEPMRLAASAIEAKLAAARVDSPARFVMMAGFVSVFNAALEEYYWRWFAFGQLRQRTGVAAAAAVSSLLFGLHHAVVLSRYFASSPGLVVLLTAGTVGGGLIWCWMYQRRGTLYASLLSHFVIDVAVMSIGYQMLFTSSSS